jgi:hypothetical protein
MNDVTRLMIRLDWLLSRAAEKSSNARSPLHSRQRCQMARDSCRLQNLHDSLLSLSALVDILSLRCQRVRGVPLGMRRIRPEYLDSDPSDRSVVANVLLRQEPDEEEEEEEDDGEEGGDDYDKDNDGYSE